MSRGSWRGSYRRMEAVLCVCNADRFEGDDSTSTECFEANSAAPDSSGLERRALDQPATQRLGLGQQLGGTRHAAGIVVGVGPDDRLLPLGPHPLEEPTDAALGHV